MLIAAENEQLVLLDRTAGVKSVVVLVNNRGGRVGSQQDRPRKRVSGAAIEQECPVKLVRSRVGDHVIDVAGRVAELRGEAVRNGLDFSHVNLRNWEQAQAV